MCNREISIILSDLNNIRVKNELKKQNIFSLGCYTNIDVYNTGQLLEFISLIDSCILHNYELSKDIKGLGYKLLNIIISDSRYKNELESDMNSHIQSISRDLTVATKIYNNYNQEAQTDNLMDYIRNNYNILITNITNLYNSNINTLNLLYYVIDGINKIDHDNYE